MSTKPEMTDPYRSDSSIDDSNNKLFALEDEFRALKLILKDVLERLERLEAEPRARVKEERVNEGNNTTTT